MGLVNKIKSFGNNAKNYITSKEYIVDTLSGNLFWTTMMMGSESYSGMDLDEMGRARGIGLLIGAAINRPMMHLRDVWHEKVWKIDDKSSYKKRIASDLSLGILAVPTIYGSVLLASGQDIETIKEALPMGTATQLGMGLAYVKYNDVVRKIFIKDDKKVTKL
jgi:hypothetical protein